MQTIHKKEALKSYILAADLLPEHLWRAAFQLPEEERLFAEEFRLRCGRPMVITVDGQARTMQVAVTAEDIEAVLARASRCSMHSFDPQIREGFLTAAGGHRIGLCGTLAQTGQGRIIAQPTSLNIRIARQLPGIGRTLYTHLFPQESLCSILLLSPPGVGKTTLLRDLCRLLSQSRRVSVADCRFELAGSGFDLGSCDVMQGGSKAESIELLLRVMSPEILAVDEITASADVQAMIEAAHTGCCFLASAHGHSMEDLMRRPLYRSLMAAGIFEKVVLLERMPAGRSCRIYERSIQDDKDDWTHHDHHLLLDGGDGDAAGAVSQTSGAACP